MNGNGTAPARLARGGGHVEPVPLGGCPMGGPRTETDTEAIGETALPFDDGGPPFAEDVTDDDEAFLAHVERVMASDSTRVRAAARPGPPVEPPTRVTALPTPSLDTESTDPTVRHRLTCEGCGWTVECLGADADRFVRAGCLLCGGAVGARLADVEAPAAEGGWNKRRAPRRAARGAARVEVRRLVPAAGPNVAVALADVCADGLGVWLQMPVRPGEQVDVILVRAGGGAVVRGPAEVRWCAPGADWTYRAGLRLRRPLSAEELADLTV